MRATTSIQHGAVLAPISNQVLLTAVIRVVIGALLLGAMVLAGIALGYASSLDLQL